MPVPKFDESVKAEKLPLEVLKWLNDAATYSRHTPESAEEVFGALKLVLRLLAVRNPDSQSHATRKTFGLLIESIYEQPGSEKICSDMLDLLIRIVDAKQGYRYNPMKHLAISGLGHLSVFLSKNMRQMAANVFVICIEALKIAPVMPQTLWYRNTILWTMTQAAATTVDEKSISTAVGMAKSIIESSGGSNSRTDAESVVRAFDLLAALVSLPNAKFLTKHSASLSQLHHDHGLLAPPSNSEIADAAARFYSAFLISLNPTNPKAEIVKIILNYEKCLNTSKPSKRTPLRCAGYSRLLTHLLNRVDSQADDFMTDVEEIYIPYLLILDYQLAKRLIVDVLIVQKLGTDLAGVDTLGMLLRQLALAQAPTVHKSKSRDSVPKPLLGSTLVCLGSVINLLGNAVQPVASSVHQATLGLVLNSNTPLTDEQLGLVIYCLQGLSKSVPTLIIATVSICMKQLEVGSINDRRKELAYIIAAMIAESRKYPLYGDVELNIRVMLLGMDYIKKPADSISYKVGWLLLMGVFCLGSQVIKPLVPQLLVLWENHLGSKFASSPDQIESALTGLVVFLIHNKDLLTPDISSRISRTLYSLWSDTESAPPLPQVRRRLLQCYKEMLDIGRLDSYPASLLLKYVAHTTSPAHYSKIKGVYIESAISTPGTSSSSSKGSSSEGSSKYDADAALDAVSMTECGMASKLDNDPRASLNNDIDSMVFFEEAYYRAGATIPKLPLDISTTVVDLALHVVAKLLPLQPERIKESVFDAILTNLENSKTCKSLRGKAVTFNIAKLVQMTLENSSIFMEPRVLTVILSLVKHLLRVPCTEIQHFALASCSILAKTMRCDTSSTAVLASMVKDILDLTIASDVYHVVRSSYILALGYIAEQWPNLPLLEAMFKILMPMAAHPDKNVHIPALASMRHALMSTEMVDQKYVKCTLKTIGLTMLLDSHNNNGSFRKEVAESLVLIVSRIGPMLSTDSQKSNRALIVCLADQLQNSSQANVRVMAWKSFIELYYYSRQGITWSLLIKRWRDIIIDTRSLEEEVDSAVNGLLMLMKLSVSSIFSVAGNGLEDALWLLLDRNPRHPDILSLFYTWFDQTTDSDASIGAWVNKLSSVVMKPRYFFVNRLKNALNPKYSGSSDLEGAEHKASVAPTAIAADEDVTLDVKSDDFSNDQFSWEARAFAIELLLRLLRKDVGDKETNGRASCVTTKKIGDIIKIAFSSATSQIIGLQYAGLALLNEVIVQFSDLADPDFPHISLLEQYQVQIISAISPAFGRDSTPSVAFAALHTCSTFLTSEVIKSKEKLHRLTRILEASVTSMSSSEFKIGEVELTMDSSKIFRVAVLSVWAEMENYSPEKEHLREIVSPWKDVLAQLWTESLYDYGKLRSILESQWSMSTLDELVSQMKDTQIHWIMRPVYQVTWVSIVRALSIISADTEQPEISPLVLCGLCFQALIETLQPHSSAGEDANNDSLFNSAATTRDANSFNHSNCHIVSRPPVHAYRLSILETLERILTPQTSKLVITSTESYFEEIVPILYRVMVNGNPDEQSCVLTIARNLVAGQPETDDSVDHFFEILKIAMQPLRSLLPQVFDPNVVKSNSSRLDQDQISLLQHTMNTLIDITQVFREVIQNDLWLCLLKIFEELNHYEPAVAAPSFKKLLEILAAQAEQRGITFIIGALTASLVKALENESTTEALLVCSALTCTNSKILLSPEALTEVQRFGTRAGEALRIVTDAGTEEVELKEAEVALQCITAVMKVCANTPSGGAFAYGCLPGLVKLVTMPLNDKEELAELKIQALRALIIYAALDGTLESMSIVVPTLVAHYQNEQHAQETEESPSTPHAHLLLIQLASKQPAVFKETVWRMEESDRNILQQLLAQQASIPKASDKNTSSDEEDDDEFGEIELKSFV